MIHESVIKFTVLVEPRDARHDLTSDLRETASDKKAAFRIERRDAFFDDRVMAINLFDNWQ